MPATAAVMGGRLLMVAAAALLAVAGTAGQRIAERTGVDLVLVDVNVVDRSGTPIGDLAAGDFTVLVDRKPRKIVTAQFIRYDLRRTAANAPAVPAPVTPIPAGPRNVLIVVDEDTLDTGDALGARKAAEKFLGTCLRSTASASSPSRGSSPTSP